MAIEQTMIDLVRGLPPALAVLVVAMTPVLELRGAIPLALGVYHLSLWQAVALALVGNMIPALIIVYGWSAIIAALERHWPAFHQFMMRYHDRLHQKWEGKINRYGPVALALFVAVPLPLSGVWSGALVAWIFQMPRQRALAAIFVGVCVAAAIVCSVTIPSLRIL